MYFFDLLEFLNFLLVGVLLVTQVFTPIKNKTPLFPYFRRKKLTNQLENINDQKESLEIEKTIDQAQTQVDEERKRLEEKRDQKTAKNNTKKK